MHASRPGCARSASLRSRPRPTAAQRLAVARASSTAVRVAAWIDSTAIPLDGASADARAAGSDRGARPHRPLSVRLPRPLLGTVRRAPASAFRLAFLLAGLVGHTRLAINPLAVRRERAQAARDDRQRRCPTTPGRHGDADRQRLDAAAKPSPSSCTAIPSCTPTTVLTSVADANGTITNTSFAPALDDLGVTFFVTATGSQSGLQATTTFDTRAADTTWTGVVSTDWNTASQLEPGRRPRQQRRHRRFRPPSSKRPVSGGQLDCRRRRA